MAIRKDGYYYNHQLTKYILHFMAVFQGMQVKMGKTDERDEAFMTVPVKYGAPDRVVASILAGNTQNAPLKLPVMSAFLRGIRLDTEHFHGVGVERREAFVPVGGLVPNDVQVIQQRMPLQVVLDLELAVYASNTDQHHQIIEQFMPLFNPQISIQLSDKLFDMARMTKIELKNSMFDGQYPIGMDPRIIQSTYSFEMTAWLETPAELHKQFVERVMLRVGAISTESMDSYEIIADLDSQNIPYDVLRDASNLKIDE